MLLETGAAQLATSSTGRLLPPVDAEYEDAWRVHNGFVDKRPAPIRRCHGVADVCDAVKLPREPQLEIFVEHFHGAASWVPVPELPAPCACPGFMSALSRSGWTPGPNDSCIDWCRGTFGALQPFLASACRVNSLDLDEAGYPVLAAYGPNHARLRQLKKEYDPDNILNANVNIRRS